MVNRFERAHSMARLCSFCNERTAERASCAHAWCVRWQRAREREIESETSWKSLSHQRRFCLTSYVLYAIVNCHQNINLLSGDGFFHMDFLYTPKIIIVKGNFVCDLPFFIGEKSWYTFQDKVKWSEFIHDDEVTSSDSYGNKFHRSKGIWHILYAELYFSIWFWSVYSLLNYVYRKQ